jgi:hypothetical protein
MYTHMSSCLQGPVTRDRGWWLIPKHDPMPNLATNDAEACATKLQPEESPSLEEPIRTDLVERIRCEIAAGTYETPEKWALALDRLLARLEAVE